MADGDGWGILLGIVGIEVGKIIGEYEVLSALGHGGMGTVYKVRNVISHRTEAMKLLLPDAGSDNEVVERFLREIRVVAGLEHPNIAQLRTALRYQDQLVMVMEYVDGAPLDRLLNEHHIGMWQGVEYVCQVLSALSYAHSKGVVHRDIKPPNILITSSNAAKLTDFGIASKFGDPRLTAAGTALGSVYYMSPEQVRAAAPDGRSDLYSVGVTLYEIVTGRRPISGDSHYSIMRNHLEQLPQPPHELSADIPPGLSAVILMSLEKNPLERFQTADDFLGALRAITAGAPPPAEQLPMRVHDAPTSALRSQQSPAYQSLRSAPAQLVPPASLPGLRSVRKDAAPAGLGAVQPGVTFGGNSSLGSAVQASIPAPKSWTPAILEKAKKELAQYIGPLANVIVNRASKKAQSVGELYDILAAEIGSEGDRKKFLAGRGR